MTEYIDWTRHSDDPNDSSTKQLVKASMQAARRIHLDRDLTGFVVEAARGKRVLDIGVVSHTVRYVRDPNWRHAKIREVAARCIGIDILEDLVRELCRDGFDVRCVDATSDTDIGERFDLIFAGDVIEHVDNAVALLRFAKRHLDPAGRLLVATPNPFSRKFHRRFMREGVAMINLDHVAWITPTMALEIGRRAGLAFDAYHLIKPIGAAKRLIHNVAWQFTPPEYTFGDFLFEYRHPSAPGR